MQIKLTLIISFPSPLLPILSFTSPPLNRVLRERDYTSIFTHLKLLRKNKGREWEMEIR
ncbi:hypothetical protein SLEP1_g21546 [Rubroshorea leprosula]|uniref:Uncharacterized protein n=1 Tax=Rubroshorea leprosula TaxID=152421 RepID=A0AAV5J9E4_9ROSI|nr:hypothetical protein SLEP1_g21546 [Rubroshorea leprosula]